MKKEEAVFVGILAGGNHVNSSIAGMLFDLPYVSHDPDNRFTFLPHICSGHSPQEFARNTIIGKFLETEGDTLVMIDDDMIMHGRETLIRLLNTEDYDIAGPLQLMWRPEGEDGANIYPVAMNHDENLPIGKSVQVVWPASSANVTNVDIVGSGIIAIKRHVLEDPKMLIEPGYDPPAFFRNIYEPNGNRLRGLDVDFCIRAKKCGYRTKVNWKSTSGHFKTIDLYAAETYAKNQFLAGLTQGRNEHAV